MIRINKILNHEKYSHYLGQIALAEKERIFCKHNIQHFLDVSRLIYIYTLERGLEIDKEIIYAIGFLHDIGRARQYIDGTDHHIASALIAEEILPECGFTQAETKTIVNAISAHRHNDSEETLCQLVYKADKKSRSCFECGAIAECNWSRERLNTEVEI